MRDPERIEAMLAVLKEFWTANPDLRLGQIVVNACSMLPPPRPDTFYIEDDKLLVGLNRLADSRHERM